MGFAESLRAVAGSFGGLQEDGYEYDDYDDAGEDVRDEVGESELGRAPKWSDGSAGVSYDEIYREESYGRSRTAGRRPAGDQSARPLALVHPPRTEFVLVAPEDFEAAQRIADLFKVGNPVIVDLQSCDRDLSRRLIDFCSGLTYAVEGSLQFIGENAVLVSPHNVDRSSDEPGGLQERVFYNQV